jgi:adenosylcobinamide-phosphate synthase
MVTATAERAAGVALGLLLDGVIGEPPDRLHPVARFGDAMTRVESHLWADRRVAGVAYAGLGVVGAWSVGRAMDRSLGRGASTTVAVLIAAAGRGLGEAAETVAAHLRSGDLAGARDAVRALVGRDVHDLDEKEICRAVVESVAENLSDAVVASALWGLVAGAPGCLIHRATNTLDAMVGHRDRRYRSFGWASARLDDLLGWPAARATAVLVALACPHRASAVGRAWRTQASAHPSPNAGVAEAAFAAALDLRLGGTNRYGGRLEERPPLGDGAAPGVDDIDRAVRLLRRVTHLLVMLSVTMAVGAAANRRQERAVAAAEAAR